jgi:hypothetical protein
MDEDILRQGLMMLRDDRIIFRGPNKKLGHNPGLVANERSGNLLIIPTLDITKARFISLELP